MVGRLQTIVFFLTDRVIAITLIFLFWQSCRQAPEWKTISVGKYQLDVPQHFDLRKAEGIDSFVGMIEGDSIHLHFDYGYYSNPLVESVDEYLQSNYWRIQTTYQFMKPDTVYTSLNMPKVDVLSIRPATMQDSTIGRGCDYVAICKHQETEFNFPVYIPLEIKQAIIKVDTIQNQYRKLVVAKDPMQGITGAYIRDLGSYNNSINSYRALCLATDSVSKREQDVLVRIFESIRTTRP